MADIFISYSSKDREQAKLLTELLFEKWNFIQEKHVPFRSLFRGFIHFCCQNNMKAYRTSFLSVAAFLMLLCSVSIFSRTATACPLSYSGSPSFTAVPGGSQSQTWTITDGTGGGTPYATVNITAGSDVFTLDHSRVTFSPGSATATFTITFTPGANATGTFTGTLYCVDCNKTFNLVGTLAA